MQICTLPLIPKFDGPRAIIDPAAEDSVTDEEGGKNLATFGKFLKGSLGVGGMKSVIGVSSSSESGTDKESKEELVSVAMVTSSLNLASTCTFFGFSKLLISLSSQEFGQLDMRNLYGLFQFCRAMNDKAFRR